MQIIEVFLFMVLLIFLHELAHVIAAFLLGGKPVGIGIDFFPVPHVYVSAINVRNLNLYYLAGPIFDIISLAIIFLFVQVNSLKIASLLNLIINSNPFYSDWLIMKDYRYTIVWYLHFIVWGILIIFLFRFVI